MSGLARGRLMAERKEFRKNRPFGFVAKPMMLADGSQARARGRGVCGAFARVLLRGQCVEAGGTCGA